MAVPLISSAKGVTFRAFQRRIASFRVASVALCDISTCCTMCQKPFLCGRRDTFATCSEDALHFYSWQAQHFEDLRCHFAWQRRTLDVSCCVFSANRIVSAARSCDKVQIPWQGGIFCDR